MDSIKQSNKEEIKLKRNNIPRYPVLLIGIVIVLNMCYLSYEKGSPFNRANKNYEKSSSAESTTLLIYHEYWRYSYNAY